MLVYDRPFADSSDDGSCTRLGGDGMGPICVSLDSPFVEKPGSNPEFDRRAYPAMLVKTSFDDSQVMYWEPAKYVAKMRTVRTDWNPLLFQTNLAGGHGGSSGRYDRLKEIAFDYAFILWQLGINT